jgi:hypothetical protein
MEYPSNLLLRILTIWEGIAGRAVLSICLPTRWMFLDGMDLRSIWTRTAMATWPSPIERA